MVSSLLSKGKDQGFLLSDEVIAAFPRLEEDIAAIDELWSSLLEHNVEILDDPPAADLNPPRLQLTRSRAIESSNGVSEVDPFARPSRDDAEAYLAGAATDSVRLYLQEIGETDLLTMQEEVWLAKRMERGLHAADRLARCDYADDSERRELEADRDDGEKARSHLIQA
ncbi:MAG TPA: sigma-70 factor domain-containing protein, partial [Thermomicrobiales bacterium]|nr:sigma-70 factor domain-containing protein [Thermomicrobiales bacterium]